MTCITILLADDHAFVRQGVRMVLAYDPDIEVVAEAVNGRQAVELARLLHPAVILMDVAMPLCDGIAATGEVLKACPRTKVIMLSAHGHADSVARALAAGAVGYLHKQSSMRELRDALRTIAGGGTFVSPSLTQAGAGADGTKPNQPEADDIGAALTPRECEVLQLITDGLGNRQTASALGISVKTVEKHRAHIMEKLGIHDIAGLTRFVLTSGIFTASAMLLCQGAPAEAQPLPAPLPGALATAASAGAARPRDPADADRVQLSHRPTAPAAKSRPSGRWSAPTPAREILIGKPDDHRTY